MNRGVHVVCALSGGVDSSVAALLLKNKGYRVTGLFMKNWDSLDEKGYCQADLDFEDARYVAKKIDIPLHRVEFVKDYWHSVFSNLLRDYQKGITPNPDILCNKHIKFDIFLDYALKTFSADVLATGHYARTSLDSFNSARDQTKEIKLLKAQDCDKDQTFFLSQISQMALRRTMFPVGDLTKPQVKSLALQAGLQRIVRKKESAGICFIGENNFQDFIKQYLEPLPGRCFCVETGRLIGTHPGVFFFTIGQRVPLQENSAQHYLVHKKDNKDVIVAPGTHHPSLYSSSLGTSAFHWIRRPPQPLVTHPDQPYYCQFKFQHGDRIVDCKVERKGEEGHMTIELEKPQRAITPGQFAVLYDGEECLGSGRILGPGPSLYQLDQADRPSLDQPMTL